MSTKVSFLSISAFKKALGIQSFDVVYNAKSGKMSVLDEDGAFYRCQQDIDLNGNLAFLLEEGKTLDQACLVNTTGTGESPLTRKATF
jgi:hypothetical protein